MSSIPTVVIALLVIGVGSPARAQVRQPAVTHDVILRSVPSDLTPPLWSSGALVTVRDAW